jgi:hypothetical protein
MQQHVDPQHAILVLRESFGRLALFPTTTEANITLVNILLCNVRALSNHKGPSDWITYISSLQHECIPRWR